jgi:hypothetical protein
VAERLKLLGVYSYVDDILGALGRLKGEDVKVETVYSPAPNEQLERALGTRPSPVRYFVLFGAMCGVVFGIYLAVYTATRWNLIVWGKPPVSIVPYVVLAFEFAVLFGVLAGILGFLVLSRMPNYSIPQHFDPLFTVDRFGLLLSCPPEARDRISALMLESGAEEVRDAGV